MLNKSPLRVDQMNMKTSYNVGVSFVEVQVTTLYFPQAGNTICALASPLPTKAVCLCGDPENIIGGFIMKKNLTEIVFILDRSGSMAGLEGDTIGGFNAMIEKQKLEPGEAIVSSVLFDNETEVIHDRMDIQKTEPLTDRQYYVRGCTALLDAVGGAIHHIGNVHKYAREEDRPEKTLFVITTDGMENASRKYSYDRVKMMIQRQQEKYDWEFIFLGANIDAAKEAARFGISEDRAANYHADSVGTAVIYEAMSEVVCNVRANKPMSKEWKRNVDADFKKRGK